MLTTLVELYPRSRPRPPGDWRQLPPQFAVAGIWLHNHKTTAERFVRAADHSGRDYGIDLIPEPTNPRDARTLAVVARWSEKGWLPFRYRQHSGKIGYVPAHRLGEFDPGTPVVAEVESLFLARKPDGRTWVNVQAYLLLPGLRSGYWRGKKHPFRE